VCHRRRTAGFTIVEVIVVVAAVVLLGVVLFTVFGPTGRGTGPRSMHDSSQLRGVMMGFVLWSQSNQDRFPLPSVLDGADATVAEKGEAKNTTANILSVLIFNSFFPPELLYSPQEANANIVRMEGYELDRPPAAVDPEKALWDPALRADFTGKEPGHVSYANMLPVGPEVDADGRVRYGANDGATRAVIGNRGPRITGVTVGRDGQIVPTYAATAGMGAGTGESLTFLIHGSKDKWEGNIGYADNHVNFETRVAPESATYRAADGRRRPDCLFFEEADGAGVDNFLGIFTKAGARRSDFATIWD
jgi:hypothetical protein